MIVFTGNPNIITPEFMAYKHLDQNMIRGFNLSNPLNLFIRLKSLFPINECLPLIGTDGFEQHYVQYIASNPAATIELLSIMEMPYLGGMSVILVEEDGDFRSLINETLASIITKMYGYPITYTDDTEDLYNANDTGFSIIGLSAFDRDRILLSGYYIGGMSDADRQSFMAEN